MIRSAHVLVVEYRLTNRSVHFTNLSNKTMKQGYGCGMVYSTCHFRVDATMARLLSAFLRVCFLRLVKMHNVDSHVQAATGADCTFKCQNKQCVQDAERLSVQQISDP